MQRIFGFDIGTTSIGWAVIDHDVVRETGTIHGLGVRIFPEARDPDGTPLNQQRRLARQMRRQIRRRRERRRRLTEMLGEAGFLPHYNDAAWARAMAEDPYRLRKEGLERALTREELGRALYHLSKRRHFRGRDLDETDEAKASTDEKEAKSEREKLVKALKDNGTTLGAYLFDLPADKRKRGHHALRDNVHDEFEKLIAAQSAHHPLLREATFTDRLEDAIFAQRPVFWRRNTLGQCRLIPGNEPAPKASWLSCQRRMLEKLNNLAIEGGNNRSLTPDERQAILDKLQTQGSMTWNGVRTALKPIIKARGESEKALKFNLERGGDKILPGNPIEAKLAAIFGDGWANHPQKQEIRTAVDERLRGADYDEIGTQRIIVLRENERKARKKIAAATFTRDFNATDEQVAELETMTFPTGWEAYSTEAIRLLLPELENGTKLGDLLSKPEWHHWRDTHFPTREQPTGEILDRLPSPRDKGEAQRLRGIRNPTVIRVLNELRKVTNNLIGAYGKPDLIRVELARDVGLSKTEHEEKTKAMRDRESERKKAEADLKANGISEPAGRDIEKWLLWKECGEKDPYSGAMINFDALFRNNEFEVEHIWPRSLSLDDSFANKTLCRRDLNLMKGDRLPHDAFGHDEERWNGIRLRLEEMTAVKGGRGMSRGKVRRFLAKEIPEGFASRQLNDTGYATREAVSALKRLWPDVGPEGKVYVQTVTGKVTAHIRKQWGLNNILSDDGEKTRADHRHHALDALVVACCGSGVTQRLSRYWQVKDGPEGAAQRPTLTPPWGTIRHDAEKAVAAIVVSHRVRKKLSGPLHKGTIYGDTKIAETKGKIEYRLFTVRKPLQNLTKSELEEIRDETVKRLVNEWVAARGGDPKKAFPPFPRLGVDGPEIRKARIFVKQQLALMAPATTGYADLGSNHHIAIYHRPDGKAEFEVVSLYEAARRVKAKEPVVRRIREGTEFVMSLAPGDALLFPDDHPQKGIRIVQGVWASGVVVTLSQSDAHGGSVWRPSASVLPGLGARKVAVDPIGRIRPAHD